MRKYNLHFRWTISRARDTYGYNVCTLLVDDVRVGRCNGGGYDMQGSCLGSWIEVAFADELRQLKQEFYGLSFHDANFDPGKAVPEQTEDPADNGKTVAQLEAEGKSLGLDRYQQFYRASSKLPTERHTVPLVDGACGMASVEKTLKTLKAIGATLEHVGETKHDTFCTVTIA